MRHIALAALTAALLSTAANADNFVSIGQIAVPTGPANQQPGGIFSSFDISFADPVTGNVFIADRSNAAVDIFSGASLTFLGRATGFTGQAATTSLSGADGVLTVTSNGITTLYAGDGDSTLKVFNATNPTNPVFQQSISTGGTTRVDEMAYSPLTQQVLAANNAETPAYASLFQTNGGHAFASLQFPSGPPNAFPNNQIVVPANLGGTKEGGMEQPVWNSATTINIPPGGSFWVSIPALSQGGPNDPGGLAQITTAGKVVSTVSFDKLPGLSSGGCSPTGLAVGAGGNMLVGCGNVGTQAILLDKNGNFIKFVGLGALGGTDEIWYDPTSNKWYVTGNNGTNNSRFFDIVDANGNILQQVNLPTTPSAHSITVDPFNGDVFVALAGGDGNTFCPNGCIDVFHNAASVPGPILGSGIPGIIAALGLLVFGRRRWQKRFAA